MHVGRIRNRTTAGIANLLSILVVACAESPFGVPAPKELTEGERLFEESVSAAEAGDAPRAFELMQQAAELGEPEAITGLATFVDTGFGTTADPVRAQNLLEEALKRGSVAARLNLGLMLLWSEDPAEQERAVALLRSLYESPPNDRGRKQFRRAAAGGLGAAYVLGQAVPQDVKRGVDLLEESDEAGEAAPQVHFLLGRAWESGWGDRRPNPKKAFRHFHEAAEAGIPRAQWAVGMALINGSGTEPDEAAAYRWIRRAAESGEPRAEISVAVMLAMGQGVAEDDEQAREWYGRGVARNLAHSLRGLGVMLIQGEGGPVDGVRGWAYLKLAAQAGEVVARHGVEALESKVSVADREAGEALAAEWVTKHGTPRLIED